MKAWGIRKYGGPEVLSLLDLPEPTVAKTDVLIEVRAASLNPIDFKLRKGLTRPVLSPKFPLILGCDVAGKVVAVGSSVTHFQKGDEVFARLEKDRMGALAPLCAADESVVAKKPSKLSFAEAASIPLAGLTALQGLRNFAGLQAGQRVLIHAGSGGVGSLGIQIAKNILGAQVATTTSTRNVAFVRSLGADEVIDYTKEDVNAHARDFDVILDTLGPASEIQSLALVRQGGVVVGVSGLPDEGFARTYMSTFFQVALWFMNLRRRRQAARFGTRFAYLFMRPDGKELAELGTWLEEGTLRPVIHKIYPFDQTKEAFAELERGRARGKIVIEMP